MFGDDREETNQDDLDRLMLPAILSDDDESDLPPLKDDVYDANYFSSNEKYQKYTDRHLSPTNNTAEQHAPHLDLSETIRDPRDWDRQSQ